MNKRLIPFFSCFLLLIPFISTAQLTIKGRILNQSDTKPVANASVFLSNAMAGSKTAEDGVFLLTDVKPGKYDLVVSIVGFDAYKQVITVEAGNITLPDILIFPKTSALNEVKVKPKNDPSREYYYELFKKEFLGESDLAKDCKILNPEVLDFEYDDDKKILTGSSVDFLVIENEALGYRLRYLLANFTKDNKNEYQQRVHYEGASFFENLEGTPAQKRAWEQRRQEVYAGSPKHFLRAALGNRLDEEGFRVFQYAIYQNPERPPEELIAAKIKYFKHVGNKIKGSSDSLLFWEKKQRLKKMLTALQLYPLNKADLVKPTDKNGVYALNCENNGLHITYNKNRRFSSVISVQSLNNSDNKDVTLLTFNDPAGYFDDNGVYSNPNGIQYTGAWAKRRMAEILPTDYTPLASAMAPPTGVAPQKSPGAKLEDFKNSHPIEKAYLHFDKPYYAAGDTIYFKAYITMNERHWLTDLSGVLHVELINTQNKIDQSVLLKINDGVCWGDFALPDSLPKGEYRMRAYTNLMRNGGEPAFFCRTIPVVSTRIGKIAESGGVLPAANKPDLQLLPESGHLVAGLKSKVAFKAIGPNGLGLDVKGTVTDSAGKVITTFASTHLGMGFFEVLPGGGKSYKASLTFANGYQNTIDLPAAEQSGISLEVDNDSLQKVSIQIKANAEYFKQNKDKVYKVAVYSGGVTTVISNTLDCTDIKFDMAKRRLHTGVNTVTLFSPDNEPLAERLFFIQNYDQLDLNLKTDKTAYNGREKVNISLNAKNRADSVVAGHFSVSVTDESKVPVDEDKESTILSSLLLTDDLKGTVEHPGYYFNNISDTTLKNLDLVMLTHGYRNFEWKEVLKGDNPPLKYQLEKNLEINGMAKSLRGKPIANAGVSLITTGGGLVLSGQADETGHFKFANLGFADSTHLILQAAKPDGSNKTQLVYEPLPAAGLSPVIKLNTNVNQQFNAYLQNVKAQQEDYLKYGSPRGILLRDVYIKDQREKKDTYRSSVLGGPGHADQVVHMDDIKTGGLLTDKLTGILRGITIKTTPGHTSASTAIGNGPMLIVVDGIVEPDDFDFNSLANDVETVEVLKYANASMYGLAGGNGVLVFTTKIGRPVDKKDILSYGILPITPRGYYIARTFYSPQYTANETGFKRKDLRTTIYWNPELAVDKSGNASMDFYNADDPGTYRVVVEGIDENGNIGRQVYRYIVK
ncbi:MAG: carboxypeptidase regulatory-like domain-containing protein [Bacteroidota bacterium]